MASFPLLNFLEEASSCCGGAADPFTGKADPFTGEADPLTGAADPLTGAADPFTGTADPFTGAADPFTGVADPFTGVAAPLVEAPLILLLAPFVAGISLLGVETTSWSPSKPPIEKSLSLSLLSSSTLLLSLFTLLIPVRFFAFSKTALTRLRTPNLPELFSSPEPERDHVSSSVKCSSSLVAFRREDDNKEDDGDGAKALLWKRDRSLYLLVGKFEFDVVEVTRKPSTMESVAKAINSRTTTKTVLPDPFLRLHLMVVVQLG
jgi:hypothetical protein